ncbi:MAG: SRPBCC family protein [Chitinophagales bacterium]
MSAYRIQYTQFLPISLETAWDFFSSPDNLREITPAYMNFRILSRAGGEKMFPGQIITYKVSPIPFISMFWMTEITHVAPLQYFIDEQRFGPYDLWHHRHEFKAVEGGVEMLDEVHYKIPLGPLGQLANWLFVRRQLEGIFEYRKRVLEEKWVK